MGPVRHLILLVDDCVESREVYAEFLQAEFQVAVAASGAEAVQRSAELLPAVVVMDWGLPDMSGEEAIAKIRKNPATQSVCVVVVSGYAEPARAPRAWDAYLVKPCHAGALAACMNRLLNRPKPRLAESLEPTAQVRARLRAGAE